MRRSRLSRLKYAQGKLVDSSRQSVESQSPCIATNSQDRISTESQSADISEQKDEMTLASSAISDHLRSNETGSQTKMTSETIPTSSKPIPNCTSPVAAQSRVPSAHIGFPQRKTASEQKISSSLLVPVRRAGLSKPPSTATVISVKPADRASVSPTPANKAPSATSSNRIIQRQSNMQASFRAEKPSVTQPKAVVSSPNKIHHASGKENAVPPLQKLAVKLEPSFHTPSVSNPTILPLPANPVSPSLPTPLTIESVRTNSQHDLLAELPLNSTSSPKTEHCVIAETPPQMELDVLESVQQLESLEATLPPIAKEEISIDVTESDLAPSVAAIASSPKQVFIDIKSKKPRKTKQKPLPLPLPAPTETTESISFSQLLTPASIAASQKTGSPQQLQTSQPSAPLVNTAEAPIMIPTAIKPQPSCVAADGSLGGAAIHSGVDVEDALQQMIDVEQQLEVLKDEPFAAATTPQIPLPLLDSLQTPESHHEFLTPKSGAKVVEARPSVAISMDVDHNAADQSSHSVIDDEEEASEYPPFKPPDLLNSNWNSSSINYPEDDKQTKVQEPTAIIQHSWPQLTGSTQSSSSSLALVEHKTPPRSAACSAVVPMITSETLVAATIPDVVSQLIVDPLLCTLIRDAFTRALGKDVKGRDLGSLMCDEFQQLQMDRRIPMVHYAAHIWKQFELQPSLIKQLRNASMTIKDLFEMYPSTEMPSPLPSWDQVVPATLPRAGDPHAVHVVRVANLPMNKRSSKASSNTRGMIDIRAFATTSGPTEVQKLASDSIIQARIGEQVRLEAASAAATQKAQMEREQADRLAAAEAAHLATFRHTKTAPLFQIRSRAKKSAASTIIAASGPSYQLQPQVQPQEAPQHAANDAAMTDIPNQETTITAVAGSDPPALERVPGALHLFSNPPEPAGENDDEEDDDANMIDAQEDRTPRKSSVEKREERAQVECETVPMLLSPAPHRSAASFLSPTAISLRSAPEPTSAHASPHRSAGAAVTAPLTPLSADRIGTPLVTVSPLTSATASSSSSDSRYTPSPAQRNPATSSSTSDGDENMLHTLAAAGSNNSKRASTGWKTKRYRSTESEFKDEEAQGRAVANTTGPSLTSRALNADYQQRKYRLNNRQAKVDAANKKFRPSDGWSHTTDGELVYTSKLDRISYKGAAAKEMEHRDLVAAEQQRQLKRSFQQFEESNREAQRREQELYAMSEEEQNETSEVDQLREAAQRHERELIASGHSLAAWLPVRLVESYRATGITQLYDWQIACLRAPGVLDGRSNIIYSASTSAGKTLVAEILLLRRILSAGAQLSYISPDSNTAQCRKVLFVLPFVSIVDEKCHDLCLKLSSSGFIVKGYHGQMSAQLHAPDQIAANRSLNTIEPEIDVAVVIIEKANSLWENLREQNRLHEICAVIIDELHMVSADIQNIESSQSSNTASGSNTRGSSKSTTSNRGYLLELLLTKVRQYNCKHVSQTQPSPALPIQVIGMSATLPNMDLFKEWLSPCELYSTTFRPVPLKEFVLKLPQKDVYEKVANESISSSAAAASTNQSHKTKKWRLEKVTTLRLSESAKQAQIRSDDMDAQSQLERELAVGGASNKELHLPEKTFVELPYVVELIKQVLPDSSNPDRAGGSNVDPLDSVGEGGGVLIFCSSRQTVEQYAIAITKALSRQKRCRDSGIRIEPDKARRSSNGGNSRAAPSRQMTLDPHIHVAVAAAAGDRADAYPAAAKERPVETERLMLVHQINSMTEPIDFEHEKAIRNGVGYHHAGLAAEVRVLIEAAFRKNVLNVLCCTTTLAYGVNLPSKRVIFQSCKLYNGQTNSLFSLIQYQQMSGRAGRAGFGQRGEGSSFIVVQNEPDFRNVEGLLNGEMPPLQSSLDHISGCEGMSSFLIDEPCDTDNHSLPLANPLKTQQMVQANRYLCHAILEAISSLKGITKVGTADIQSFLGNTLLAHQTAFKGKSNANSSSSSATAMRREVLTSLKYLQSKRLISESTNCSTMLGSVLCETGLNPVDGVRLCEELKYMRERGWNFASHLQICWLLTPEVTYNVGPQREDTASLEAVSTRWERMRSRWARLSEDDKYVLDNLLNIETSSLGVFQRSVANKVELIEMSSTDYHTEVIGLYNSLMTFKRVQEHHSRHRAYFRAYEAMVLLDLLDESKPNLEIQQETLLSRGELQHYLTQACHLCNQLTTLSERQGWRDISLVLESYRDRFAHNGASTELLQLLRIPSLKMTRARWLQELGIDSVERVARAGVDTVLQIFRKKQPYHAAIAPATGANQQGTHSEQALRQQQEHKKKEESKLRADLESARTIVAEAKEILQRQKEMKKRLYQL